MSFNSSSFEILCPFSFLYKHTTSFIQADRAHMRCCVQHIFLITTLIVTIYWEFAMCQWIILGVSCIVTHLYVSTTVRWMLLILSPFYRWRNWGTQIDWVNCPKVLGERGSRARPKGRAYVFLNTLPFASWVGHGDLSLLWLIFIDNSWGSYWIFLPEILPTSCNLTFPLGFISFSTRPFPQWEPKRWIEIFSFIFTLQFSTVKFFIYFWD